MSPSSTRPMVRTLLPASMSLLVCLAIGCVPGGGSSGGSGGAAGCEGDACTPDAMCGASADDVCDGGADTTPPGDDMAPGDDGVSPGDAGDEPDGAPGDDMGSDATVADDMGPDVEPDADLSGWSSPGGPCEDDADCERGSCGDGPGGRCVVDCETDVDCGPGAECVEALDDTPTCVESCADEPCRADWVCADVDDRPVCLPDCAIAGCPAGFDCEDDGVCTEPVCMPMPERCDGLDDDCDDRIDEESCPAGSRCEADGCRVLAGPAAPCERDDDCASDVCSPPDEVPGGFCQQDCQVDGDCGPDTICALPVGQRGLCGQPCADAPCRDGWVCAGARSVCTPGCQVTGCLEGLICGEDGNCDRLRVTISLEQVFIGPTQLDGSSWDGFRLPPQETLDAIDDALGDDNPVDALIEVLESDLLSLFDKPDAAGTATLFIDGRPAPIELPEVSDSLTPQWPGTTWPDIVFEVDLDLELQIRLSDVDILVDDDIGTVTIGRAPINAARRAGEVYPVVIRDQGVPILLVAISVTEQR